ncbi:MAG: hypothetical protein RL033_7220, partial [Pseudomonadota bacterium]
MALLSAASLTSLGCGYSEDEW